MDKKIKKNYMYNLMYEVLALVVPLITTPYVSRVLGATAIGDYSFTSGIVIYFSLFASTGTKTYAQREIAKVKDDIDKRSKIFWETFFFRLICSAIALVAYLSYIQIFLKQYHLLFLIQLFTVFSWVIDISWFFQGMENFKITSIRNALVKLISTIAIFTFVKNVDDLWKYTLILSLSVLIGNLTMWGYIFKNIIWIPLKRLKVFANLKSILSLFIPVIAMQLYTVFDKTMIGALCNTTETGYYTQAEKVIKIAITVLSSLISVLLPRIALLFGENNTKKINEYYINTLNFIFMLALPMMVGCIMVSDIFVPIFFGEGYMPVINLMRIESLLFIILSIGQLLGSFLIAMNLQKHFTQGVTAAAIVNLILNYIFIKYCNLGALGAAISSVIAETVSTSVQFYHMRKTLKVSGIFKAFLKYVPATVVMIIAIIVTRKMISNTQACLAASVLISVISYFVILLISKDKTLHSFIHNK